jgi:hypothetical protein
MDAAGRSVGRAPNLRSTTGILSLPGAIAQLGERLLCKQEVTGSIPVGSTGRLRVSVRSLGWIYGVTLEIGAFGAVAVVSCAELVPRELLGLWKARKRPGAIPERFGGWSLLLVRLAQMGVGGGRVEGGLPILKPSRSAAGP